VPLSGGMVSGWDAFGLRRSELKCPATAQPVSRSRSEFVNLDSTKSEPTS
jgi:hypothetical protein